MYKINDATISLIPTNHIVDFFQSFSYEFYWLPVYVLHRFLSVTVSVRFLTTPGEAFITQPIVGCDLVSFVNTECQLSTELFVAGRPLFILSTSSKPSATSPQGK